MSGRALRRLPVLALARYIGIETYSTILALSAPTKTSKTSSVNNGVGVKSAGAAVGVWLDAMEKVVKDQAFEHEKLS